MSLRCVGNQLLQTAPSLLFREASTASASFWVQVNPGNDVDASNGVEIFGESAGKFSARLSGTGSLLLQWSSNNGQANGDSTCALTLMPGTSYHVATTWRSGAQRYYLNGVPVGADNKAGSLGALGDSTPYAYRLGSDQAGTDVTIDQPTLWVGYALTATDVANLLGRTVQPGGVSPSSIALEWSLSGTAGAPAKVGDAGLVDASTNALNLSSIVGTAPTYQSGDLTYAPKATIGRAIVAPSGRSIVLLTEDGTGLDSGITSMISPSEIQSVQFSAPPSGDAFALSFGGDTTPSLPVTTSDPADYGLWTIPTVAGHTYTLAATFLGLNSAAPEMSFELIEAGSVVDQVILTCGGYGIPGNPPIPGFNDAGVTDLGGSPTPWQTIVNSNFVATGTSIEIRVTGGPAGAPNSNFLCFDAIRVNDITAGTIAYYDDASTYLQVFSVVGINKNTTVYGAYDGTMTWTGFSGIGPVVNLTGGASALQSALQALPSIGQGGVSVADLSNGGTGNYHVSFTGSLANASAPLLSSTDSNISIASVNVGGVFPTIAINGGKSLPLADWIWTEGAPMPYALSPLLQSAPASQTFVVGNLPYSQSTSWDGQLLGASSSLSGQPTYGFSAGLTMSFTFEELPPGTYQFAATYPNAPFSASNESYQPSTATQFLVQDGSGNTLAAYSVDQTKVPADYQSEGQGWKNLGPITTTSPASTLVLVMNTVGITAAGQVAVGEPQPVAILDAVQLNRTSPDASIVIGADDTATINIPANWATTQAGPIPAVSGLAVAPPSPNAILPPFVVGPKTLQPGYNVYPASYAANFLTHSNLAYLIAPDWNGAFNSDQYPTTLIASRDSSGNVQLPVAQNNLLISAGGDIGLGDPWQGTFLVPPGKYVMTWDGDGGDAVRLIPALFGTSITDITPEGPAPAGAAANWRIYDIQFDTVVANRPAISIYLQTSTPDPADASGSSYIINLLNLGIFPPDPADPTGQTVWGLDTATNTFTYPPKFHPSFLYKMQGSQCVRFLDPISTNNNPASQLSHFKATTHANRNSPTLYPQATAVSSIQAPSGANYWVPTSNATEVVVTTTVPHGLFDGARILFSHCGTMEYTGGSAVLDFNSASAYGDVHVIDATHLAVKVYQGNESAMTNTTTGGSIVCQNYGTYWPLQDMVDLVTANGASQLHFNAPLTLDTTPGAGHGAYDVGAALAAMMPSGMKLLLEAGNENWNGATLVSNWCFLENARMGDPNNTFFTAFNAQRTFAIHEQFVAAFTAAGRAEDVVRIWGGMAAFADVTSSILQDAARISAPVDMLCVGPYFNSYPVIGYTQDQLPIFDAMTPDQLLDYTELNAVYGGYTATYIAPHQALLATWGYGDAKMMAYEWACDMLVPTDPVNSAPPGITPNYTLRQNAVKRHPRMYGIVLHFLQAYQDAGLSIANWYELGNLSGPHGWDAFDSGNQQRGTGNMVADAINVASPQAKNQVLSEVAGATNYWSTLVATSTTVTPPPPKKPTPGRNGRISSIGFPRGTFRLFSSR